MKTPLKLNTIMAAIATLSLGIATALPTFADSICDNPNVASDRKAALGCPGTGTATGLDSAVTNILMGIIAVSGLISVVYVLVGGINYISSRGDPGKTEKAKKTILYALIGLAITALAFAIVNFVINNIIG